MLQKKKDFINRTMRENGYNGPISGFSECIGCGECCKLNACSCVPDDFEDLSIEGIEKILDSKKYMITCSYENANRPKIPIEVFPHISAREILAPENGIHITMLHSKCSLLGPNGCKLSEDERPAQGLMLIPFGHDHCKCFIDTPTDLWEPYKGVLDAVIYKRTGKTSQVLFEEELKPLAESIKRKVQLAILYNENITPAERMTARAMNQLGVFYGLFGKTMGEVLDDFIQLL